MTNHFSELNDKPETQLSEKTIWMLQQVRRANAGIIGCIEILNEDGINEPSIPGGPAVFIRLETHQRMGLELAIEACSRDIARIFDEHLEDLGVEWLDDICSSVTKEAQAVAEMQSGDITYEEFEKKMDGEDPLQSTI